MLVGYARTSSLAQVAGLEAQERELRAAGCDKIFREQVSSVAQREQLEAALDYVREGDTFTVTKLDRLARSVGDLLEIVARLEAKKVSLRVLVDPPRTALDIECEYGKFYDVDDDWVRPAGLRLFSKVPEPCECEHGSESQEMRRDPSDAGPAG